MIFYFSVLFLFFLYAFLSDVFKGDVSYDKNISYKDNLNEYELLALELGCSNYDLKNRFFHILKLELKTKYELDFLIKKIQITLSKIYYTNYESKILNLLLELTNEFKKSELGLNYTNRNKDFSERLKYLDQLLTIRQYTSFCEKYINIIDSYPLSFQVFISSLEKQEIEEESDFIELFYFNNLVEYPPHDELEFNENDLVDVFYNKQLDFLLSSNTYLENDKFRLAVDLFNNNKSFFLSGSAGTGKSSFINFITSYTTKKYAIVAPTGIAALNVKGQTIHSFFKFDPNLDIIRYQSNDVPKFEENTNRRKLIENIDVIIIDEISMVSVDIMDAIDYSLRINGGNPKLPFGGKQIIIIGDVFQLGPIVNIQIRNEILNFWTSIYFFNSISYSEKNFQIINLIKNYRNAEDQEFIKLLDRIKLREILPDEIALLSNGRIINHINQVENKIILTTTNSNAKQFNDLCLNQLDTDTHFYEAEIIDSFPTNINPTERTLELKVGAQIMFIKNDSLDRKWVNGTIGKVLELNDNEILVKLNNDTIVRVNRYEFESYEFQYEPNLRKTVKTLIGKFVQFPIKLAWAITINKSQGLTFDEIIIDVSNGTFGTGQLYVALSRARKLSGIYFTTPLLLNHIRVDENLIEFYNQNIINKD